MAAGSAAQGNSDRTLRLRSRVEITASAEAMLPSARCRPATRRPAITTSVTSLPQPQLGVVGGGGEEGAAQRAQPAPQRLGPRQHQQRRQRTASQIGIAGAAISAQDVSAGHSANRRVAKSCPGHADAGFAAPGMIARRRRGQGIVTKRLLRLGENSRQRGVAPSDDILRGSCFQYSGADQDRARSYTRRAKNLGKHTFGENRSGKTGMKSIGDKPPASALRRAFRHQDFQSGGGVEAPAAVRPFAPAPMIAASYFTLNPETR